MSPRWFPPLLALALCLVGAVLLFVFIYNSGYGYDGLEAMVIGRSLLDGYSFFDFPAPKTGGLYFTLAALFHVPFFQEHLGLALLTLAADLALLGAVYLYTRTTFNPRVAAVALCLVAACSVFMELNFLMTEPFMLVCALAAASCLVRFLRTASEGMLFAAGVLLGIGFNFKQSSLFFLMTTILWLFLLSCTRQGLMPGIVSGLQRASIVLIGCVLAVAIPALWFVAHGDGQRYVLWTFYVPLIYFPASTEYLDRLYTKVVWFPALLVLTVLLSLRRRLRETVYTDPAANLNALLGVGALPSLLKSQAPHYLLPGAVFLTVWIAFVFDRFLARSKVRDPRGSLTLAAGAFALLLLASLVLYRPAAFRRLLSIREYRSEAQLRAAYQELVPADDRVLFLSDNPLKKYWFSHRYPNTPLIDFDVQATYWDERDPTIFEDALADPRLRLVEFDPRDPPAFRFERRSPEERRALWRRFERQLSEHFTDHGPGPEGSRLWLRR